jgi:predicted helicase
MRNLMGDVASKHRNLALVVSRAVNDAAFAHVFIVNEPVDRTFLSSKTATNAYVFPLYILDSRSDEHVVGGTSVHWNLSPVARRVVENFSIDDKSNAGENLFYYLYALLWSQSYRSRYAELLKIDFPRVPLPRDASVFRELSALGAMLGRTHLLETDAFGQPMVRSAGRGGTDVAKGHPKFANGKVMINPSRWFEDLPENVWEFHIGGYQVCEKWLKDRRGRTLSQKDIEHYQKIIAAISETIRLMSEIDRVIDAHGGWPGAFASN